MEMIASVLMQGVEEVPCLPLAQQQNGLVAKQPALSGQVPLFLFFPILNTIFIFDPIYYFHLISIMIIHFTFFVLRSCLREHGVLDLQNF